MNTAISLWAESSGFISTMYNYSSDWNWMLNWLHMNLMFVLSFTIICLLHEALHCSELVNDVNTARNFYQFDNYYYKHLISEMHVVYKKLKWSVVMLTWELVLTGIIYFFRSYVYICVLQLSVMETTFIIIIIHVLWFWWHILWFYTRLAKSHLFKFLILLSTSLHVQLHTKKTKTNLAENKIHNILAVIYQCYPYYHNYNYFNKTAVAWHR